MLENDFIYLVNSDYVNYGPSTKNTEHYKDIEVEKSKLRE